MVFVEKTAKTSYSTKLTPMMSITLDNGAKPRTDSNYDSRAGLCTVMVVDLIKPNDITRERAYKTFYDIEDICSLFE